MTQEEINEIQLVAWTNGSYYRELGDVEAYEVYERFYNQPHRYDDGSLNERRYYFLKAWRRALND